MRIRITTTKNLEKESMKIMGPAWGVVAPPFYKFGDTFQVRPESNGYTVVVGEHSGKYIPRGDGQIL
jgi:hypothetical protein